MPYMDRTTKKQLGMVHGRVTPAGVLKAHPTKLAALYEQAVSVVKANLDLADLDAAKFVINHSDGTPTQKIQHTGKIENVNTNIDVSKLTDKEKAAMRDIIAKTIKG